MKFLIKLVASLGLVYGLSACSTQPKTLEGVATNGGCNNPKCKCAKPCKCKPVCQCGMKENLTRDKK